MHTHFNLDGVDCYMEYDEAVAHKDDIMKIKEELKKQLADTNFKEFDLCDVSAGGIQVIMFHKDVSGYSYGDQFTILHDWSNVDEVISNSVANFKKFDNEDSVRHFKNFIDDGNRWGWD